MIPVQFFHDLAETLMRIVFLVPHVLLESIQNREKAANSAENSAATATDWLDLPCDTAPFPLDSTSK
jgi:hypothetical protein